MLVRIAPRARGANFLTVEKMIALSGLTKKFGPILAVDDINLTVNRGEVVGFLGPNGAGKTTTMRMVTGFLPPSAGTAEVCGFDVVNDPISVKQKIGYVPEGAPLYDDMTPKQFLTFIAGIRGIVGAEVNKRIDEVVEKVQLRDMLNRPIETLSKGYKRRVALAQAMLHDPEVLILDEPTDGLDPNQKDQVRNLINEMAQDKAIVISTHILEEVEAVCTRAVIIASGKLVFDGTPEDMERKSYLFNAVSIRLKEDHVEKAISAILGLENVKAVEDVIRIDGIADLLILPNEERVIISDVSECIRTSAIDVEEVRAERGDMFEVFHQLTAEAGEQV
jgi:ABC-2 type transport system ATP-binding protein